MTAASNLKQFEDFLVLLRGSPASVSHHVMTSQDHIKTNTSGPDFLALVVQSSNSFDLNVFFQVLFTCFLTVYKGHI